MTISLVVAASENNVIGKNNKLLWHLPNDMKFFKNITWAMPVIMGRKTFDSMGGKTLAGRQNIIITRQKDWHADGTIVAGDLGAAFGIATTMDVKQVFVIGGSEIYKQAFGAADLIYLTRVHAIFEGDAFFPAIKENEWTLISNHDNPADEKHIYAYSFQVWKRNK